MVIPGLCIIFKYFSIYWVLIDEHMVESVIGYYLISKSKQILKFEFIIKP